MNDDEPGGGFNALAVEHRNLDERIRELVAFPGRDQLELARLKKRKLFLKDRIAQLHASSIPDIIA